MKSSLLLLFCVLSIFAKAQEKPAAYALDEEYNLWNFQKADTAYIFADLAYIRDYPNLEAGVIDSLTQGNQVIIKSVAYRGNTIRGFYAPWHEISYIKDNQQKKGFVWLGLLALNGSKNNEGELFICGLKKFRPSTAYSPSYYESELKIFDKEQMFITKEIFHANINGQSGIETKILPGMGLQNIRNIHRLGFLGEACGIASQYYYFAWNGTNLIHFPEKMSVSDAGVFYHQENILFPSEHKGDSSMIYKNIIDAENTSENPDDLKYKETKSQKKYTWDGKVLSEIITMK